MAKRDFTELGPEGRAAAVAKRTPVPRGRPDLRVAVAPEEPPPPEDRDAPPEAGPEFLAEAPGPEQKPATPAPLWLDGQPAEPLDAWEAAVPDPTQWVVQNLLPEGSCMIIGAEMKTGKTWITLALALALASRGKVLGTFEARRTGRTLLYTPEGGRKSFERRLWRLCWGLGLNPAEVGPLVKRYKGPLNVLDAASLGRLVATIREFKPSLLVLDPLINLAGGADENSSTETQAVLDRIRALLELAPEMCIVVCHHLNKGHADHSAFHGLRGASAIGAWADGLVKLRNVEGKPDSPRRVDVVFRDEASPDAVGFNLVDGALCDNGLRALKLDPCDPPEPKGLGRQSAAKAGKLDKVAAAIAAEPGKWTAPTLAEHMGEKSRTMLGYVADLEKVGRVCKVGWRLHPVEES